MKIDDIKIGDLVEVLMTGSYYCNIEDINDTQFYISGSWQDGEWYDKTLFFIGRDMNISDYSSNVNPNTKPEILMIRQGDMFDD